MKSLPILLSLAPFLPITSAVTCYRPNGVSSTHDDSKTCHSINGAVSMCCNENDECLQNGICKVAADAGVEGSNATYWRDTCSVSNWPEVGCLKVCASGDLAGDNSRITPCDGTDTSEKWCCGTTTDCCGTDEEVHVPQNIYTKSTTSISTSTTSGSTSSSTTTTTSSSTPTPTADDSDSEPGGSSGLSGGAKAGVGVGVAVGAIAIIAGALYFMLSRRRSTAAAAGGTEINYAHARLVEAPPLELDMGQGRPYEKPAGIQDSRHELP
ncbi:hypothetical protein BJY01DRAFT_263677 [Aspergillus pseudoustus]|uniref:Mid2 domain-containing protein n=1 Tax=Aspergillus pseudoustus TaxID=1810923 RepID=A0ABR4K1Z9_9EURO